MKTLLMLILIMKNITNNTMYAVHELRSRDLHTFLHSFKVSLVISIECNFFSSIILIHSSTNLSINQ